MADIFISYSREDHSRAEQIADALETTGWSVWWDRIIPTGETWDNVVEEQMDAARCVVVLWSKESAKSQWVRAEASEGQTRSVLAPVLIEEDVRIPLAFRQIQCANLIAWDGAAEDSAFQTLTRDIRTMIGAPEREQDAATDPKPGPLPAGLEVFEKDVFISYAHLDDEGLGDDEGWVSVFQSCLEVRLSQLFGARPRIWRDLKLQGNDIFGDEIVAQFPKVALMIAVLSPSYVRSEWCNKEVEEFCKAAEETGGIQVGAKSRIFKVIKTPVPVEEHPFEIRKYLGYEFYDPDTGRHREFDRIHGGEDTQRFLEKLNDLACDVSDMLTSIERGEWQK